MVRLLSFEDWYMKARGIKPIARFNYDTKIIKDYDKYIEAEIKSQEELNCTVESIDKIKLVLL